MVKYRVKYFYYTGISLLILLLASLPMNAASEQLQNLFLKKNYANNPCGTLVRVTQVHDGDTISIRVSSFSQLPAKVERVRLIGIDAPELKQEPWGRQAKRHLKKLISESDWVVCIEYGVEQHDTHGRLLAYLWDKNGRLINMQMVEDGYSVISTIPPNVKYTDEITAAQEKAKAEKRGIWKEQGLKQSPQRWREENPRTHTQTGLLAGNAATAYRTPFLSCMQ